LSSVSVPSNDINYDIGRLYFIFKGSCLHAIVYNLSPKHSFYISVFPSTSRLQLVGTSEYTAMPDEPMASIALSVIADAKVGWREPTRLAMEVPISASLFHMLELLKRTAPLALLLARKPHATATFCEAWE
jgi:hypothetical protein